MKESIFSILYVEDDTTVSKMISLVLKDLFKNVYVAENGKKALELFEKESIDVILTDIRMPILDGLELIKIIRKKEESIPIIVCSAHNETNYLLEAIEYKVDRYIIKPIDLDFLDNILEKTINQLQVKKELEKLQNKVSEQNKFLHMVLNNQPTMIAIFNQKNETTFVNNTFLKFFNCKDLDTFKNKYISVEKTFIENDNYFHIGKIENKDNWIEYLNNLSQSNKIVSMLSYETVDIKTFKISIAKHDNKTLLTFTDISETFLKQLQLENKTMHDKLTGAFNREYFENNYQKLVAKFIDETFNFGIAILDIDRFKGVNDKYGHDIGDQILIEFVEVIKKHSRIDDYLIRWGGEEFIFILKIRNYEDLKKSLEKLRLNIEKNIFTKKIPITCSMGGTIYSTTENMNLAIKRADNALYKAKNEGRNKVFINKGKLRFT